MKIKRIYRMFFNMINDESMTRPVWSSLDDDFILITDGCKLYRMPKNSVPINLAMLRELQADKLPKLEITKKHQQLEVTNIIRDSAHGKPSGYIRKLKSNDFNVWINNTFLDMFDNPTLHGTAAVDPVIVCEQKKPVGILMPIRLRDDGGDED